MAGSRIAPRAHQQISKGVGMRNLALVAALAVSLVASASADPQALFAAVAADDPAAIEKELERTDINSIGYNVLICTVERRDFSAPWLW